jgi:hypothetical protein
MEPATYRPGRYKDGGVVVNWAGLLLIRGVVVTFLIFGVIFVAAKKVPKKSIIDGFAFPYMSTRMQLS